ncbi:MAG: hypothetical protein WD273_15380 [Trueperaceae bacterium]
MLYALLIVLVALTGCGATTGPGNGNGDGDGDLPGNGNNNPDPAGPAMHNTIAYVPADTGDEIRVIDPDGSNDRQLWSHGEDDPFEVYGIWDLDWSPDAREIAFASSHENYCSLFYSDIYAVGTSGGNYRRMSAPPACGELADYPKATVNVPVRNYGSDSLVIFMYFLGAPSVQQISLPAFGSGMITFDDVADLGAGVDQYGMMIEGSNRELAASTAVDVQPNGNHTTAEQSVYHPGSPGWESRSPTWHSDGTRVGYLFSFNTIYGIQEFPDLLELGDQLVTAEDMPNIIMHLNWNPAEEWADELIYVGWNYSTNSIYWVQEGTTDTPGTPLLDFASYEEVLGLAWLPDGNGFVFSVLEEFGEISNLWRYSFDTETATRITSFTEGFAGDLSVSPDGNEIVFERGTETDLGWDFIDSELWIVGRDGGNLRMLVENAAKPDWSSN